MDISRVDKNSYLVKLSPTEEKFLCELSFSADRSPEKTFGDIAFAALVDRHAQLKVGEMLKARSVYWD